MRGPTLEVLSFIDLTTTTTCNDSSIKHTGNIAKMVRVTSEPDQAAGAG